MHRNNSRPVFAEIEKAKPRRGNGTPSRCASHKSAILTLLRERGPQGVLGSELYNSPEKFGRSPRNRISELRKEGCLISGEPNGASDWHYVLIRDAAGQAPAKTSGDWFTRQTGKERPQNSDQLPAFELTPP